MPNDLLSGGTSTYDAHSIEVLEGLEPVRKRPGMTTHASIAKGLFARVVATACRNLPISRTNKSDPRSARATMKKTTAPGDLGRR